MDRTATRRPDGAIAESKCAIAERLLVAVLQGGRDKLQMVLYSAGGDPSAHADRLAFDRSGGARRLLHVDLWQLGESSNEKPSVAIVCTLAHPNEKFLPLVFATATARELGASKVGLISPYLAYMLQDRRFAIGEAVTSRQVAHLISEAFDWMVVTVDPHLHRYGALGEIYSIPTRVVHAAPLISQWVKTNIANPLIIGPDSESEQWVSAIANDAGAPYCVLEKVRHGDRDVQITLKDIDQ